MNNYLKLHRFNGTEQFVIESAKCFPVGCDNDVTLWFEIKTTREGALYCADTQEYPVAPNAELGIEVPYFTFNDFVGREFYHAGTADDEEDSCDSIFYYHEHQPMRDNRLMVLSQSDEGAFRIRWTARTGDVMFYDGSKLDARIEMECDFSVGR